jgi:Ca2+-transporting ATPase
VLFGWPILLSAVHIVILELIIDPACSIVFEMEDEEAGTMNRPPRDPSEPLVGKRTLFLSVLQGVVVLLAVLGVFKVTQAMGWQEAESISLSFATLIFANLSLIVTNRSWSLGNRRDPHPPEQAMWWVIAGTTAFLALVLLRPVRPRPVPLHAHRTAHICSSHSASVSVR